METAKKVKTEDYRSPMDRLPDEIIRTIFTWLCIKSLFTCRSVCQTWRSVVDSPSFSIMHFANSINDSIQTPSAFIMLPRLSKGNLSFKLVEDQGDRLVKFPNRTVLFPENSRLFSIGSCNSLVCLSNWYRIFPIHDDEDRKDCATYICNPATGKYFRLPDFTMPEYDKVYIASGFGCDPSTNDFKVILICKFCSENEKSKKEVQLYSLASNSWKNIELEPKMKLPIGEGIGVFLNGHVHWLMKDEPYRIVSFDMVKEKFGIVPMPKLELSPSGHVLHHGSLGGCLCLSYCPVGFGYKRCEIWIMKDYNVRESWVKQYVMDLDIAGQTSLRFVLPLWLRKNGEIVLRCGFQFLVSYNPESEEVTRVDDKSFELYPYVGSLVSPVPGSIAEDRLLTTLKRRNTRKLQNPSFDVFLLHLQSTENGK